MKNLYLANYSAAKLWCYLPHLHRKGAHTHTCACGASFANTFGEPTGKHVYDNDRDSDCNTCGVVREVVVILVDDANGDGKVNNRDLGLLQQKLNFQGM